MLGVNNRVTSSIIEPQKYLAEAVRRWLGLGDMQIQAIGIGERKCPVKCGQISGHAENQSRWHGFVIVTGVDKRTLKLQIKRKKQQTKDSTLKAK